MVIRQSKECLDDMNEWCQVHHVASGKYLIILKESYISVVKICHLASGMLKSVDISNLGLAEQVLKSEISERDAEKQVCYSSPFVTFIV